MALSALGFGLWDLIPSPFRRVAWDAPPIVAAAPVGELFEVKAVFHQLAFELRLARRAGGPVEEFMRDLRIARPADQQARPPFGHGRPNQPD